MGSISQTSSPSTSVFDMQTKTRQERGFQDVERDMQSFVPSSFKTPRPLPPKRLVSDPVSNVLSYLGSWNPYPQPVTKQDEVWLFDNTAFASTTREGKNGRQSTTWQAEFITAVFLQHPSSAVSDAVVRLAEKIGLANDEQAKRTIEKRIRPFLMDIQPGKQVLALYGDDVHLRFKPGGRNGISADIKTLPSHAPAGMVIPTTAEVPRGTTGLLQCKTFFSPPSSGWAVISDIDDTIKVTLTGEPIGILRSTFVDEPRPVAGMPELYRFLQKEILSTSPFFYLSASPYNLYPFLRDFRDAYYPHGQLILRDSSWMTIPGLLTSLTLGTQDYKVDRMKKIHGWIPNKHLICIGDSTQTDPEAYGEMYRTYGQHEWVRLILIRKVTDIAAIGGIADKNKPQRFEKAFRHVPRHVWHVFEEPAECYSIIRTAVAAAEGHPRR